MGVYYFMLVSELFNQGMVMVFVFDEKGVIYKLIFVLCLVVGEEIIIWLLSEKVMFLSCVVVDGCIVFY